MTRPQRRLHLLAWLVLAPCLVLLVLWGARLRVATWGAIEAPAATEAQP